MKDLLLIVEGHGDIDATRVLASRVCYEIFKRYDVNIHIQRRKGIAHLKGRNWENFTRFLTSSLNEKMPILWLLDTDCECPISLLEEFLQKTNEIGFNQPIAFCFWHCEYETMFLLDLDAIKEHFSLSALPELNVDPDNRRGVKEWISSLLPSGSAYKEMIDQPAITAKLNLDTINHYRAFKHFVNSLRWLLEQNDVALYPYEKRGLTL